MVERCPHEHAAANCVERNLLRGERRLLELIAAGRPLRELLGTLCLVIEEAIDDARCSVLLLNRQGQHLHHAAAPRRPRAYCDAIDGVQIGPSVGSCGTAACGKRQ